MTTVAGHQPAIRGKAQTRRNAAIAASVLAHVAVLAIIGLTVPKMVLREAPQPAATDVWLMPRLTLEQHTPAEHKAAAPKVAAIPSIARAQRAAPAPTPAPRTPAPAPKAVAAPAAQGQAQPQGAPGGKGAAAAPSQTIDGGDGVQRALRTSVGCDYGRIVHLNPGEADRCNQTGGAQAKTGPAFIGIDPLKRGRFDEQVDADERKRNGRTGPMQELNVPCAGVGSNLASGCLPDSAIAHIHQH